MQADPATRPGPGRKIRIECGAGREPGGVAGRTALSLRSHVHRAGDDLLTPNGVVAGRISSYDEVRKNPDVEATGLFIDVEGPDGTQHTTLGSPWHLASVTGGDRRGAPGIGQHTAELLGELGYTGQDISTLAARSVIGLPQ